MRPTPRSALSLLVAGVLLCAATAHAEERALNLSASVTPAGELVVAVNGPLPKGLFTNKNQLQRDKSALLVTVDIAASDCLPAWQGTVDAATQGSFGTFVNPKGQVTAYSWSVTIDLAAHQNHWNNHLHCDGSIHLHGCTGARTVTVMATLNNPGHEEWGGDQTYVDLAAVQDPDTAETDCCDPGQILTCETECSGGCASAHDACKATCADLPGSCCTVSKGVKTCTPGCVEKGDCMSACGQANGDCHSGCNCECLGSVPGCTPCE